MSVQEISQQFLAHKTKDLVGKPVEVRVLFRALSLWNKKPSQFLIGLGFSISHLGKST
jgi:hypothetical protein